MVGHLSIYAFVEKGYNIITYQKTLRAYCQEGGQEIFWSTVPTRVKPLFYLFTKNGKNV